MFMLKLKRAKNKADYKRSFKIYAIVIGIFLIFFGLSYLYLNTDKVLRKEAVSLVQTVFDIDISDTDFTYSSSLKRFELGGRLEVKVIANQSVADTWLTHCTENFKTNSDFAGYIAYQIGIKEEELSENLFWITSKGPNRKIPFSFQYQYVSPKSLLGFQNVYFHDLGNGSTAVYFFYYENACIWSELPIKKLFFLCFIAWMILILKDIFWSKKKLCIKTILSLLQFDISDFSFEYYTSLKFLKPGGELFIKIPIDAGTKKDLIDTYTEDLKPVALSEETTMLFHNFLTIQEINTIKKSALIHRQYARETLVGTSSGCIQRLYLAEHETENATIYLYYKE